MRMLQDAGILPSRRLDGRALRGWNGDMSINPPVDPALLNAEASGRPLTPAAQRALAEAAERRARAAEPVPVPKEIDGRGGPEPVRYGDWEIKGIASDF